MLSSRGCALMIERHEASRRVRFDFVTRLRPDLAVLAPLPPLCHYRASTLFMPQAFNVDWLYIGTRDVANAALNVLHLYQTCNGSIPGHGHFEAMLQLAVQRDGFKRAKTPMAVALASQDCELNASGSDYCTHMAPFKGRRGPLGCCVEALRVQCFFDNNACETVLQRYKQGLS
jgi:hypothetical protein